MTKKVVPSRNSRIALGIAAALAVLTFGAAGTGTAAAGVTTYYGPYQTATQCWIDVEAAHENGQTVTQGCQWRSINGVWGYYFVAY
jgi:hypothetical protein